MSNIDWLSNLCLNEVSLINTYYADASDYPMKNTGRHHYGFIYTIEGTETYVFNDRVLKATPDSVLCIPKGEKYSITFEGEKSVVTAFDFELETDIPIRPFVVNLGRNASIRTCFNDAKFDWLRKSPEYLLMCKAHFYKIVALLMRHENYYSNNETYSKISLAVLYLNSHYLDPEFKIEQLALLVKMSPRYFEMLFFSEFKMTPKEYVISLKMSLAKELLLNEKNTVSSVATQLGYSDVYHFSKIFKAKTGCTPTQYKKSNTSEE